MRRKFSEPSASDLFQRIMDAYNYKERGVFRALVRWYYPHLTDCMKKRIDDIIDEDTILRPIRQAYADNDYYEMKRLIDENAWLLKDEKVKQVRECLHNIYPSKLLQYAHKIFYVSKDTTKD